jgi:hypothetical protein
MPSENKPPQESPGSINELPRREFSILERIAINKERKFIQWIHDSHLSLYKKLTVSNKHSSVTLKAVLPALLSQLQNKDSTQRQIALQVIYQGTTTDDRYPFRWQVPQALTENTIKEVLGCLRDSDPTVCREAVHTLSGFLPAFLDTLSLLAYPFHIDAHFVKALADHGVRNRDPETAISSIALLWRVNQDLRSFAVPPLISALNNKNDKIRQNACGVLGSLGRDSIDAVPKLVQLAVSDTSDKVRLAAIDAALQIAGRRTAVELFRKDASTTRSLIELLRIGGEPFRKLRYELLAPQLETQDKSGVPSGRNEGPIPPDKFAFNGKVNEGLRGKSYKLVEYLWNTHFRTATSAELADEVWGDDRELDHYDLGSARSKANTFFKGNALPFRIRLSDKCQRATLVDLRRTGGQNDS